MQLFRIVLDRRLTSDDESDKRRMCSWFIELDFFVGVLTTLPGHNPGMTLSQTSCFETPVNVTC
jgi:hypothetical protein